ncbi:MAG: L,D-transpeptidase family protein [Candidatus Binatia bacterium]
MARRAGIGFNEVKDANPDVDVWIPPPGTEVEVPTRRILPATRQRGIVVNVPEMRLYLYPQRTRPGEPVQVRTWAVAIGDRDTPTPRGAFTIRSKDENRPGTCRRPSPAPSGRDGSCRRGPQPDGRLSHQAVARPVRHPRHRHAVGDRPADHARLHPSLPEDIGELYRLVEPRMGGAFVYEPIKLGEQDGRIFVEVHADLYRRYPSLEREAVRLVRDARLMARVDPDRLRAAVAAQAGVPVDVTRAVTTATAR